MELGNKKRARDGEEEVTIKSSKEKVAKKLDVRPSNGSVNNYIDIVQNRLQEDINNTNTIVINNDDNKRHELSEDTTDDKYLETGVFDIPWPEEGIISRSPSPSSSEWCFQDTFSWSVHQEEIYSTTTTADHGHFLCETRATSMASIDFPADKFDDSAGSSISEMEDCTWTSLFSDGQQPLLQQKEGAPLVDCHIWTDPGPPNLQVH